MTKLNTLEKQQQKAADLAKALSRSMALEELWPEVFEHGKTESALVGHFRKLKGLRLKITDGSGVSRVFPLTEVPDVIRSRHLNMLEDGLCKVTGQKHAFQKERARLGW